jgi:hypothetical protein
MVNQLRKVGTSGFLKAHLANFLFAPRQRSGCFTDIDPADLDAVIGPGGLCDLNHIREIEPRLASGHPIRRNG